jgi:hypothetical protein
MNWRKLPPRKAGKYWTRLSAQDPAPTIIELVEARDALRVVQLGRAESLPFDEYLRGQPKTLEFYGRLRIPKTPIARTRAPEPETDPVTARFAKQTDSKVVLAMVNEYLAKLPPETRAKIPRPLRLPTSISTVAQLEAINERLDEAGFTAIMEDVDNVDNPALEEVTHFLQSAWLQLLHIAYEAELDAELDRE